jgi:hypothetical protein
VYACRHIFLIYPLDETLRLLAKRGDEVGAGVAEIVGELDWA